MANLATRFQRARFGRTGFVAEAISRERTDSVLDIGSGEGWLLGEGIGPVQRRVGVDIDQQIVARARVRYPQCEYLDIDGATLPFRDEEFDAVVLSDVLEHVGDENKKPVIDEALRVTRAGGRIIITVPHRGVWSWLDPLDFKRRYPWAYRVFQRVARRQPWTSPEIGHKHVTRKEVTQLLDDQAQIERLDYSGWFAPAGDVPLALGQLLHHFGLLPFRMLWGLGEWQTLEASLPAPKLLAGHLRLVARRR